MIPKVNLGVGELGFKARVFNATSLCIYGFSTLYASLSNNLIKGKRIDHIERTSDGEGSPYLACNDKNALFYLGKTLKIMHGLGKMYVMHRPFCWTTFSFDLAQSRIDK